jgi:uncharacterized membrane protein
MGDDLRAIRPGLVALPLGLLVLAALFDLADFLGGTPYFGDVAFWVLAAGALASAVAALVGLTSLFALPMRSPARSAATRHGLVHIWSVGLLSMVWLARSGAGHHSVGAGLFLVEVLAFAGVGFAYRHGAPLAWRSGPAPRSTTATVRVASTHRRLD